MILLLSTLLSPPDDRDAPTNLSLIRHSLALLSRSEKSSSICARGIGLIKILLEHGQLNQREQLSQMGKMELGSLGERRNGGERTLRLDLREIAKRLNGFGREGEGSEGDRRERERGERGDRERGEEAAALACENHVVETFDSRTWEEFMLSFDSTFEF